MWHKYNSHFVYCCTENQDQSHMVANLEGSAQLELLKLRTQIIIRARVEAGTFCRKVLV